MAHARTDLPRPWTVEEFLDWERQQEERYEYIGGIIRMMVGGTSDHATIALNIGTALRSRVRGSGCRAYVEAMKVKAAGATTYPDVLVTCSPVAPKTDEAPEPVLLFEVLSRSTETFDRGAKWLAYQTLPSLRQFVLVSQDERKVEVFERSGASWTYTAIDDPEAVLTLPVAGASLTVAEIYEDTSLDPRAA